MTTAWTYPRQTDKVLTVRLTDGRRRTLRASEILDLVELDSQRTEVIYRSGQRITVPVAFETMYNLWTDNSDEWQGA